MMKERKKGVSKLDVFEHIVTEVEENIRLDKLLVSLNSEFSRQQIQSWIKENMVTVNNKLVKANYKCKPNDYIKWSVPLEKEITIEPEEIPLNILYEDDDLLVVNKPKGMLVHPTETVHSGTLVNALKQYTDDLSTLGGEDRPGIVHRLDQNTSGVLVVCKNDEAHAHLKEQFKQHIVKRIYEAVVHGVVEHDKGIVQAPIGRDPKNRLKMAVVSTGKEAETHFQVLERMNHYTHLQCQLITGRTHQIRVHMQYMNHPIVGDELYSSIKTDAIKHQALFARTLGFIHPRTKEFIEFSVEQPDDFKNLLQFCRNIA